MWQSLTARVIGQIPVDRDKRFKAIGAQALMWNMNLDPSSFAQMIAKIGYCYAIAEIGNNFNPLIIDYVLSRIDLNFDYFVGDTLFPVSQIAKGIGHRLTIFPVMYTDFLGVFVVVRVHLFDGSGAPVYDAVVGTMTQEQATKVFV